MHGLHQAQRALLGTISDGLSTIGDTQEALQTKAELPPLGSDSVRRIDFKFRVSMIDDDHDNK